MHPALQQLRDLVDRHRTAALGVSYGAGALLLFLLVAGLMGRASRSNAEESEAAIERRLEAARARRAVPAARVEPRRKPPRPRRAEPAAAGIREYEVQVRDGDGSMVPVEPLPAVDAPPEEGPGEAIPDVAPGEGDELNDPEG